PAGARPLDPRVRVGTVGRSRGRRPAVPLPLVAPLGPVQRPGIGFESGAGAALTRLPVSGRPKTLTIPSALDTTSVEPSAPNTRRESVSVFTFTVWIVLPDSQSQILTAPSRPVEARN